MMVWLILWRFKHDFILEKDRRNRVKLTMLISLMPLFITRFFFGHSNRSCKIKFAL
ncbi:hypothetical protein HanXRQr2_Chr09g0396921 [Helianthus annuus]|uniref:Uncharacterized protein n=1 Tax=Helianthus annuus TaxID=4232 RepID=A0A9K3I7M8_HELAN|nr:hypothetical protein HanXRQr2_Chr09g0396921 [Helianthus annuus]KAJ0526659.1 hypothetical protein HanHA300_Chr09g0325651 [Helianthus annuus]KAJ0543054.1 hypothetical protein HanHA89_Chr09g0346581 [Helianthus annuus]KAJ0708107.1 hypothetical protein HanLR1_Chr09g0325891 [Helianthus annuus]KAJ0712071.1 hypothetical protein HanOQP8_Chr09g0330871 [Helianthus annuus]